MKLLIWLMIQLQTQEAKNLTKEQDMAVGQETVLDEYAFLVSETDAKGNIRFANNDFVKQQSIHQKN